MKLILSFLIFVTFSSAFSTEINEKLQEIVSENEIDKNPIINLPGGQIRGCTGLSRDGKKFSKFLGIKYGNVPKRFSSPEPVQKVKWDGVKDATKYGEDCIQRQMLLAPEFPVGGSEDCLFINVFTPSLKPDEKLPVIVHIMAGGYVMGVSKWYKPDYFMDEPVVLVNFNFRQGPFGFLNAGVKSSSGNQGFKDQVLALKWVQENIEYFGGNPSSVTLYGEAGSGGVAVNYHILSPMSRGLFTGAISSSGVALSPWTNLYPNPEKEAKKLAHMVDCPTSNLNYMVECLQKVDAKIMMNNIKNGCDDLLGWDPDDSALFMGQSVDSSSDENDVFLPKTPKVLMEEGMFSRVPWIIGSNIADGAMFFGSWVINNETNLERFNRQWSKLAPKSFLYNSDVDDVCAVNSAIKKFYFKDVEKIDKNVSSNLTNAFTDRVQNYPVKKTAEIHAKGGGQVYLYQFALKGETSIMDFFEPKEGLKDPSYSDDLLYVMETPDFFPNLTRSERFIMYSKNIVKLWTSFATHGKPTELWGNKTNEWPAFDTNISEPKWMEINEKLEVKSEEQLFKDRINFWEKLNV